MHSPLITDSRRLYDHHSILLPGPRSSPPSLAQKGSFLPPAAPRRRLSTIFGSTSGFRGGPVRAGGVTFHTLSVLRPKGRRGVLFSAFFLPRPSPLDGESLYESPSRESGETNSDLKLGDSPCRIPSKRLDAVAYLRRELLVGLTKMKAQPVIEIRT